MKNEITQNNIQYRQAKLNEIIQLRHDVLIVGTNRTTPDFDGDTFDNTYHFGAFVGEWNVSCLSMMHTEIDHKPCYQLRGMATHSEWQGNGIGTKLLLFAEQQIVQLTGIEDFWCNARIGVERFYLKHGWVVDSEPFMIEGVCMHIKMKKKIQRAS